MKPPSTLVVLPTYQEAANIRAVLSQVRAAVPYAALLVVDDGSPDGTADLAEEAAGEVGDVTVLRRHKKLGLGDAYRAGFAWGLSRGFEVLVQMDVDLSHDPAALPSLLAALNASSADVVIGSRYVDGGSVPDWAAHRRLLSRWGNAYARAALGVDVRDTTSGYRVWRAEVLRGIDVTSTTADGYAFLIEILYRSARLGHHLVEVPIQFLDRTRGKSKMSGRIMAEAMALVTWWGVSGRAMSRRRRL